MFRDREKALQELQKQLLEEEPDDLTEEEEEWEEEDTEEDWDDTDLPQEVYDDYAQNVPIYNTDATDTDLEEYAQQIYAEPRRKTGCALWFILATAGILLVLSYFLAKQGGLL